MDVKSAGQKVLKQLNDAGYEAYFVGGVVRDTLLGRNVYDVDITTSATPDEVMNLFDKVFATGVQHGTVTVVMDFQNIEVTTFRLDGEYLNNRYPKDVIFSQSLTEDLARRDFTINAMARGLDGTIIDPFNGQDDLEARIIRAVGDPKKRFEEDALRILRGMRFVAKLGFDIEENTLEAMKGCCHLLANLSLERIRKEIEGIIEGEYRRKALEALAETVFLVNIPHFPDLFCFRTEEYEVLDEFDLFLLIVEEEREGREAFWADYPLTKREKKMIKDVKKLADINMGRTITDIHRLGQYYFGEHTTNIFCKYMDFDMGRKDEDCYSPYIPIDLPIQKRADLAIQQEEVIKLSGTAPSEWVNELFTEIEEEVILGKIENTRESILKLIEKRGIFDVEES